MTKTGLPLDLSAPAGDETVSWSQTVSGNAIKTNEFAKETNILLGKDKELETDTKDLTGAVNELYSPEFTEAEEREEINTGETLPTLFGKVKKWLKSLGAAAFLNVANNLVTNMEGSVLDARMGKELSTLITNLSNTVNQINGDLSDLATIRVLSGNFCNPALGQTVPYHAVAKIYNKGKNADIQISLFFEHWVIPASAAGNYAIFNPEQLKTLCGGKKVSISPQKSTVAMFEPNGNPVKSVYFGRSGLSFRTTSTGSLEFCRVHNASMDFGGWDATQDLYKAGRYAIINIVGAVLT